MATRDRDPRKGALLGFDGSGPRLAGRRLSSSVSRALAFLALLFVAPALFAAYVVKLKDGSLVFARAPYTVKATRAIITLENGIITQIPLDEVDEPGTEKYNSENFGNAIAIPTPREKTFQLPVRRPRSGAVSSDSRQSVGPVLRGGPAVRGFRRLPALDGRGSGSPSNP
jgi:hypothetical protein